MKFTLTVSLDNDAFQNGNLPYELGRILDQAALDVRGGSFKRQIRDINGHVVGEHYLEGEPIS